MGSELSESKQLKKSQPHFEVVIEDLTYSTNVTRENLAKLNNLVDRLGYSPIDRDDQKGTGCLSESPKEPTVIDRLKDLADTVRYQNSVLQTLNNRLEQFV